MNKHELSRSKEYKIIGDRADATSIRAIQHHSLYRDIFVFKEAERLKASSEPSSNNKAEIPDNDYYLRVAEDNVDIRVQQRLDRISQAKASMQKAFVKERLTKANSKKAQTSPVQIKKRSFSSFAKDLFGKAPVGIQSPPSQSRNSYNAQSRTNSLLKIFQASAKNKLSKTTNKKTSDTRDKPKKMGVIREYTIGGPIERLVHNSIDKNQRNKNIEVPVLKRNEKINATKTFNRVRSIT